MSINAAKMWHDQTMARLKAIDDWIRKGKPDFYDGTHDASERELNKSLQPLLADYARLSKRDAFAKLAMERDELLRLALVRLFSGFEAEFQTLFARRLKSAWDRIDAERASERAEEVILEVLPNSIEICLQLFKALEPRFSTQDKNWLDGFRSWRNNVVHGGFIEDVKHEFEDTYRHLTRILDLLKAPLTDEL